MTSSIRLNRRVLIGGAAGALVVARSADSLAKAKTTASDVSRIIRLMPLKEKISQMFCVGAWGVAMTPGFDAYLREIRPSGVIFVGANIGYADDLRKFVKAVHDTNPGLPPIIGIDQEGGPVLRITGDPSPGAVELGLQPDKTVRELAKERAHFLTDFGFDVNFAPVADVAYRPSSFMIARSFGADPNLVANKVADFVR